MLDNVGERYGDFAMTKILPIPELKCTLRELVHEISGAQVMHLFCDDSENLFSLSFKTLPNSSNGVAHILEHTVLCGSHKFPVKDPFFAMTRRSLNTYMNALTGSDFTCYPAATQVEKDFYNLLDVYIDAVFHPQLKEVSFLQEGHRLEFSEPENPQSPLEHKGIVYNEMKGSLASADTRLWHAMMKALFPNLTYGVNSGGDPKDIPKLTYQELIRFHETYYHPSRCLFFFYGNLPLKKHLDFIAEKALKNVARVGPQAPIPLQPRFHAPQQHEETFPVTEEEDLTNKSMVAFGWVTTPLIAQEEVLALCVLDSILMETDASLLKQKLLKSDLCIHADAYMDIEMSEVPYLIVCKGCAKENADALEKTLLRSLEEVIAEGIPKHMVETAIHQLEFARTEISGEATPFGLTLFMRSALAKQHGCPPENALVIHALFEKLIEKTEDPAYLTGLIRKYLLGNPHRVRLLMTPDPKLASQEAAAERRELDLIRKKLTPKEESEIVQQAKKLALYQEETAHQNLDVLPKVGLEDVPRMIHEIPLKKENFGNMQLFHHTCFTNQILYADLVLDLPAIKEEELPYLQLLVSLITEIGAGKRNYLENLEYMQTHTGGVGAALTLHLQTSSSQMHPSFVLRGKALHRKADKLFTLFKEMITAPRFDEKKRIQELILQLNTSMQNRFTRNAIRYALQLALSGFSPASHLNNLLQGLPYYKTIQHLAKSVKSKKEEIIEKLLSLSERIFCPQNPHLVLSCDERIYEEIKKQNFYDLPDLPVTKAHAWEGGFNPTPITSHARPISSPVAFTVEAFPSIHYLHPHAPGLSCAMPLFENKILHRKIREEGGAYGTGASFNPAFGNFYFHSYRDPQLAETLASFRYAIEEMALGHFDERDLDEAKLGVIQGMDHPIAPGSRAATAYNWMRDGKTSQMRQHYRETILSLSKKQLQQIIEKEILPKKNSGVVVSFAGKELLEAERAKLKSEGITLPLLPL